MTKKTLLKEFFTPGCYVSIERVDLCVNHEFDDTFLLTVFDSSLHSHFRFTNFSSIVEANDAFVDVVDKLFRDL